jgi:hypothetical protein
LEGVKESGLEASIDRSLGRQSPVSVCTLVEGKPKRIATAKQLICGIAVAVAYQHCLQECETDDRTNAWSNGSNLAAIAS